MGFIFLYFKRRNVITGKIIGYYVNRKIWTRVVSFINHCSLLNLLIKNLIEVETHCEVFMEVNEKIIFDNLWQLIDNEDFSKAEKQLQKICEDNQYTEKGVSYANYMIGCIHTARENREKKPHIARHALLRCIESNHPFPMAYLLFSDIEGDRNVAINYLKVGLEKFPVNPAIYRGLLKHSCGSEKVKYINEIDSKNIMDAQLLKMIINFFISENDWVRAEVFSKKVLSVKEISEYDKAFYTLAYSFSLILQNKDMDFAEQNFKSLIKQDVSNDFKYSHHMGYLWCLINNGEVDEALEIFDKIPISMAFEDLISGPVYYPVSIDFEDIYKKIFDQLRVVFGRDKNRKKKTDALEAHYLYTFDNNYGYCRYKKKHIKCLSSYLLIDKGNLNVACALFNMQVHFELYYDAYCTFMNILGQHLDPEQNYECEVDFFEECPEAEIFRIYDDIIYKFSYGFDMDIDMEKFISYIFEPLINFIYNSKLQDKYKYIVSIAKQISLSYLLKSDCKFELAYSYAELDQLSSEAEMLYLEIIKEQPDNTSALNNVGVIFEKRGDLNKAVEYFQKAHTISSNEMHNRNFNIVRTLINSYEKALTLLKNENVWLLGKLNLIYNSADLKGEFSCSYQGRAKLLALSPKKATEIFDTMLERKYFEKVSSGNAYKANRYTINPLIKEYLATQSVRMEQNEPYEEMASCLNYDYIVNLGYTQMVESTIDEVQDSDIREILKRDVREAAVALATKQYKSCIVMCGSIIEAILTSKIISSKFEKYDIGLLVNGKSKTKKVLEMDLNELLELAKKESLIDIGEYHLSNFVRCYRNIIHPSVEIRKKFDANENNAKVMWSALLLIINGVI